MVVASFFQKGIRAGSTSHLEDCRTGTHAVPHDTTLSGFNVAEEFQKGSPPRTLTPCKTHIGSRPILSCFSTKTTEIYKNKVLEEVHIFVPSMLQPAFAQQHVAGKVSLRFDLRRGQTTSGFYLSAGRPAIFIRVTFSTLLGYPGCTTADAFLRASRIGKALPP